MRSRMAAKPYAIPPRNRRYFRSKLRGWFQGNARDFPWRRTRNPYHILIAEILLQQTDAKKVAAIYKSFTRSFRTPAALARSRLSDVRRFISKIGLDYRARRLISMARQISGPGRAAIPSDESRLMQLPGVGPYIARAVLAAAFGKRVAVVDTNVIRVLGRFFGITSPRPRPRTDPRIWATVRCLLPRRAAYCRAWNYAILDFAAATCRHRKPRCAECPCRRRCHYFRQGGAPRSL